MIQTVAKTFDERKQMYLECGKEQMINFIKARYNHLDYYSEEKLAELLAYWEIVIEPYACKEVTDKLNKEQNIKIKQYKSLNSAIYTIYYVFTVNYMTIDFWN